MSYFYEIRAHFGKDLPKADTFGEIDAYLRFFVPGIENYVRTKTVERNYNPHWKETINVLGVGGQIPVELWDHNDVMAHQKMGFFTITEADIPCSKKLFQVKLVHKTDKTIPSLVCLSIGRIVAYHMLRQRVVSAIPNVLCFDSEEKLYIPLGVVPALLGIEYSRRGDSNSRKLDIKLLECSKDFKKDKVIRFSFAPPRKYRVQRITSDENDDKPLSMLGPYSIFGETKISDVRFSSPLASLFVQWGEQELVFRKTVAEITKSCGWRGGLNYLQAKHRLRDSFSDDSSKSIYVKCDTYGHFKLTWSSSETYEGELLMSASGTDNFIGDVKHVGLNQRTHKYPEKQHTITGLPVGVTQQVFLENLSYPVYHNKIVVTVHKLKQTQAAKLLQAAPLL